MSWWRTGTLAVAGTIPVRSVNASATLARSEGHHPAGYRTAIPTRVYESGSGAAAAAHAVPVRHPFPARPCRHGEMRTSPEVYATRAEAERALWAMASDGRADCTHDRRFYALVLLATFASLRMGRGDGAPAL